MATVKVGRVISNTDKTDSGRIKVLLLPEDGSKRTRDGVNEEKIAYAFPLLPKHLHIIPKVNEYVFVLNSYSEDGNSQRYYIGPIVSQMTHLFSETSPEALSYMSNSEVSVERAPSMDPETDGAFPSLEDIALEGRGNCGIQIKDKDVRIKAGVKVGSDGSNDVTFNKNAHAGFIKIKYDEDGELSRDGVISTTSIVSDRINLIGNRSRSENSAFSTGDEEDLITDKEMKRILEKAYKLPYGEILVEFLSLFRMAFINHTHNISGKIPLNTAEIQALKNYTLDEILSDNIRIN